MKFQASLLVLSRAVPAFLLCSSLFAQEPAGPPSSYSGRPDRSGPALVEAQALIDSGKLSEAETAVRRYLESHQDWADAHYLLAYILFREGNPSASLVEYREGERYRAPAALDWQMAGSDYFLLEDYPAADRAFTEAARLDPENPLALYFLGRAKYNEKRFEEAVRVLRDSLALDPNNARAQHYLGLAYERQGQQDEALSAYRAAVALESGAAVPNAGPYLDLGALLAAANHPDEAVPSLLRAVRIAPGDARAHRELGKAYLAMNKLEQAQSELEKAAQLVPQDGPVHYLLSQAYRRRGLTGQARAESERYAALSGSHSTPETPLAQARMLLNSGRLDEAEGTVRGYLEVHKNSGEGHFLLGYILFKEKKAKLSLTEYTEGAKYQKPGAYDLEAVAADYVLLEDYIDADKWFTRSLELSPGNLQALYYLGRTKYNENRFEEAIAVFAECLKRNPKDVKAEDNLGLCYEALGRVDDAIAAYRQAIAWQAEGKIGDAGPYVNLGALLSQTSRPEEAVPSLVQAIAIAPGDVKAHRELGKAYLQLNRLADAQGELEKVVELAPENAPGHFMLGQVYRRRGLADKAKVEFARYAGLTGTHSTSEKPER
jgi:tetratricopeptide (TPR) repeat protein